MTMTENKKQEKEMGGRVDNDELETMVLAERQVEAFLRIMSTRYGLKEDEIPELLDNMKWVVKHRKHIDNSGTYALFILLGLVVTGLVTAMWEGIKHMLTVK